MNRKDIQPIIKVHSKSAVSHFTFQVPVCGGNDAHVGSDGSVSANAFEFLLLQDSQQRNLHFRSQFADLIEEYRSTIRGLEASDALVAAPP